MNIARKNIGRNKKMSLTCEIFSRYSGHMQNVSDIIVSCGGRKGVAALVGVTPDAVRLAEINGKLPAMWFDALERAVGANLPRSLFTFKTGTA